MPTVEYRIKINGGYFATPANAVKRGSLATPRREEASVSPTIGHALYRLQCAMQQALFGQPLYTTSDAQIEKTVISETPARWELVAPSRGQVIIEKPSEGELLEAIRGSASLIGWDVSRLTIRHVPATKEEIVTVLE